MKPRLAKEEVGVLADLLKAAFTRVRFVEFLYYSVGESVDDLTGPNDDYPTALRKVLEEANASLWWRKLLLKARNARPEDPGLLAFAEQYGLAPGAVDAANSNLPVLRGRELELKIIDSQSTYDIATWRNRLGEIESRVCRIEYPGGQGRGTGVLISKNAVLTNYHVIEPILDSKFKAEQVVVRFDYKVQADGLAVAPGVPYGLAANWLYASSPYSEYDLEPEPAGNPALDELDFAILKVNGQPGADPIGGATGDPKAVARLWLKPSEDAHDFGSQPALYIVQHPDAQPMQVAVDSRAVVGKGLNGNGTRVRYTTTTAPGSSGSPCFGPDWSWVALHHSGDPAYARFKVKPKYNEGIPLTAILALLRKDGREVAFGSEI